MQGSGRPCATLAALGSILSVAATVQAQTPLGTAFTNQGRLMDNGQPANAPYDLQFTLFDAASPLVRS